MNSTWDLAGNGLESVLLKSRKQSTYLYLKTYSWINKCIFYGQLHSKHS